MIVKLANVEKSYFIGKNELKVLNGIDLQIDAGGVYTLMGSSGAGKSTLLNLIGLLDIPTAGTIHIDGKDMSSLPENEVAQFRNRTIGFVFQFHHLLPEFTVRENVAMPGYIMGMAKNEADAKAEKIIESVGLAGRIDHKPNEISGGEQQRVAVARALLNDPAIVLADEPTGNLDRENGDKLQKLIWELAEKTGQTFLIATHNEKLAEKAGTRLELYDGYLK